MEQHNHVPKSDEMNLAELLKKLWQGRKITITLSVVFALLGILFALSSPNIYSATTTFLPKGKSSGSAGGSLSGLASLAGITLGGLSVNDSEVPPTLYPMLIKSNPFVESLLEVKVPKNGAMILLKDYLIDTSSTLDILGTIKKYTIGLPGIIKKGLVSENPEHANLNNPGSIKKLTVKEEGIYNRVKNLITLTVDKREGFVTISAAAENPEIAGILAQKAQYLLQQKVIDFKIKNAQELLTFTENLYAEKKIAFEVLQDELATFQDQHQHISSGLFENKLSRLESELAIASAVNEELAKQVEQARIQVRKDAPVFTIIDPVVIPNQKSSPKRTKIVLEFTFFGFVLGISYALIKEPFTNIRKQFLEGNKKV